MNITVNLYTGDGSEWDAYVMSHQFGSNYHLYKWRKVIEQSFGHSSWYLVASDSCNEICGILPIVLLKSPLFGRFMVSLPFLNYGGMLVSKDCAYDALLKASQKLLKDSGSKFVEFRHINFNNKDLPTKQSKVTMILDLKHTEEEQWSLLNFKVRNQVRKAQKHGLESVTGNLELLDGFYSVFCRNMRDLGTPVYSRSFFYNILNEFPESTRIISILLDGKTIASALLTWYKDTMEVPWASSIRDYRTLCSNNMLYWEAIRFAINKYLFKFDFGRSTMDDGTYKFKKQWGAKPSQLYWQYVLKQGKAVPEINRNNSKYDLAIQIWKRLPLNVSNFLGPYVVRGIP